MKKQLLLFLSFLFIYGCSSSSDENSTGENSTEINVPGANVTDIDGNVYHSVTNCNQTWTKTNLNVSKYTDGTPIPQVTEQSQWATLTTGAWCYFENNTANGTTYGKLYNWYAVAGIYNSESATNPSIRKKLAPTGWHIPTDVEWTQLTDCLGGIVVAGGKMKSTGISLWLSPNTSATNESGFTALPGSFRYGEGGSFGNYLLGAGYWWCDAEQNQIGSMSIQLWYDSGVVLQSQSYKKNGFSVRCVKD